MSTRRVWIAAFCLTVCFASVPVVAAAEPGATSTETWQTLAIKGQRIGYGHMTESRVEQGGKQILVSDLRLHTVLKRFNGKLTLIIEQHVEEDAAGNLRSFTFRMDNPPASRLETTGRIEGNVLKLTTTSGGQSTESQVAAAPDLKSPFYVDRMLEESPLKQGDSRTLSLFDPQLASVVSVKVTGLGPAEFTLPNGKPQPGTHAIVEYQSGIPGLSIDCYSDAAGQMVLNESKLLGTTTWNVTREEALKEIPADIDLGLTALVKVDRLPDSSKTREVEYRVTLPGGLPDALLPESDSQSVKRVDDETVLVTVRSLRPGDAAATDAASPDAKYVSATAMARSDDPEIEKLAAEAAPADASPDAVAIALEKKVHEWLTRKNMANNLASASEVIRSREGDCTEHAVLLTALLRARKIPARVVVGLVYWDQFTAFAGHAWTEAWLGGRWVPLDATQADGGIGADHIRLGDTSLADGDTGLLAASISTWRLLDKAKVRLERIER
jgi:transglutaminase-like putative cysteine protease